MIMRFFSLLFCLSILACSQPKAGDGGVNIPPNKGGDTFSSDLDEGSPQSFDASWGAQDASNSVDLGLGTGPDTSEGRRSSKDGFDGTVDSGTMPPIGGGSPCDQDVPAKAELGAPGLYFESWNEGASIPLSLGSEGGISVRFNLATWGLPEVADSLHSAVYVGDQLIAEWSVTQEIFVCQEEGYQLLVQYSVDLSPDEDIFSLVDQSGRIEVELTYGALSVETSHSGSFELDL
jgi:hypothetical protein